MKLKYMFLLPVFLFSAFSAICFASQAATVGGKRVGVDNDQDNPSGAKRLKTEAEDCSYYIQTSHSSPDLQRDQQVLIELFKNNESIGYTSSRYISKDKKMGLVNFFIDETYRSQKMGSYLFKYTVAYLKNNFNYEFLEWSTYPMLNHTVTPEDLKRLVCFYCAQGAIDDERSNELSTCMHYPLPSAQMLTVMMPILEPHLLSKDEKDMVVFPSGRIYNHSPSDALGIIANFMGEKNEDEGKKL